MKSSQVVFVYKSPDIRDGLPYRDERLHIYSVDPEISFNELCVNQICCPYEEDTKDKKLHISMLLEVYVQKYLKQPLYYLLRENVKGPVCRLHAAVRVYTRLHAPTRGYTPSRTMVRISRPSV